MDLTPRRVSSGAPWESQVGYCRAVRCGPHIWVSGTAPVDAAGAVVGAGDPQAQALQCLKVIDKALRDVGADMSHVVRTRVFVVDVNDWPAVGRAHQAVFADHPPASTMVEISALISPDMLVEIEAEAFVADQD